MSLIDYCQQYVAHFFDRCYPIWQVQPIKARVRLDDHTIGPLNLEEPNLIPISL